MNRSLKIPISESAEELKTLVLREKEGRLKERLQFLWLLKTGQVRRLSQATSLLGRHRHTLSGWLNKYQQKGLEGLLERRTSSGRPSEMSPEVLEKLQARLKAPEGFKSYRDVSYWLEKECGIQRSEKALFYTVHIKLGASPKVARPRNPKQDPATVEAFKKTSRAKSRK